MFFKKKQKTECALTISNNMDIQQLIQNTMYIIANTNRVFFSYPVFKLYANNDNYDLITSNLFSLFHQCIDEYGSYQVHIDLNSYTISACERYKPFFPVLFDECFRKEQTIPDDKNFTMALDKLFIYNTPSAMETIAQIMRPLVHEAVRNKIVFYDKSESGALLAAGLN
jgi:hypothetical protein